MSFVANAINQAYVPWFYEKVNEGKQGLKRIVQTADASICLVSVFAIVMSLFAEEIFGIMINNPAYNGVWRIVPCIVFAYVFQSIYFFFVNVLFLQDTQFIFIITVTSIFVNIGLNLLLIPEFGFVGSAIACLLTYFMKSVIALVVSSIKNKVIRFHWVFMYAIAFIALMISLSSLFITFNSFLSVIILKFIMLGVFALFIVIKYKSLIKSIIQKYGKKTDSSQI